jgi:hypothetical protein
MEKTKEFDKAWKKTCPTCEDNPSNILYYKKQCSACEDKDVEGKIYTKEDMIKFAFDFYYQLSNKMEVPFNLISENRLHAETYYNKTYKQH